MDSASCSVWQLGCLFYELLTGFPPFAGDSLEQVIGNLAKGQYFVPKTVGLSMEGLLFLDRCLKYLPEERIQWFEICLADYMQSSAYDFQDENTLMLSRINAQEHNQIREAQNPQQYLKHN